MREITVVPIYWEGGDGGGTCFFVCEFNFVAHAANVERCGLGRKDGGRETVASLDGGRWTGEGNEKAATSGEGAAWF